MYCSRRIFGGVALFGLAALLAGSVRADDKPSDSFAETSREVNKRMVKVYGAGGFRGLVSYGSGIVISPDGYILTVDSHLLNTAELRVHLWDGRRVLAKVIVTEPEADVALLKIDAPLTDLPYFDLNKAVNAPPARPGDWILGFSNPFHIAVRDEPMSVQRGVIQAHAKLRAQRGVHEVPFAGEVYIIDAITNNPGAAGGAITTRKGELVGIIGKELKNSLTDTWINYAVPVNTKWQVPVKEGSDQMETINLLAFVERGKKGVYKPRPKRLDEGRGGYTGILLVANPVERTPPYIDEVVPDSPAAKAGLKPDDLIVYIDGEQVPNITAYHGIMNKIGPGTTVTLEVRRVDKDQKTDKLVSIKLTVDRLPTKAAGK